MKSQTKDYQNLWLKYELLLPADVSKNNSLKNYGLCPSHYLSLPSSSWDAMFNMTKVELEVILDPDMYILFEKGASGGASYISTDTVKEIISIWNLMTQNKNQSMLYI